MWRPALHYRWSYRGDALLLSRRIVDEMMARVPVPGALKRLGIASASAAATCVATASAPHARARRGRLPAQPRPARSDRRKPAVPSRGATDARGLRLLRVDVRHFGLDRRRPRSCWHARRPSSNGWRDSGTRADRERRERWSPESADWSPILREIGGAYLPYLCANAEAWKAAQRRFDVEIQGTLYRALPVSR